MSFISYPFKFGTVVPTATMTGWQNTLPWGVYNVTPTTRTNGQGGPIEVDDLGSTRVVEQKAPGAENNSEKVFFTSHKFFNTTTSKPTRTTNLSFQTATISSAPVLLVGIRIVNVAAAVRWLFLNNATSIAGAAAPSVAPIQIPASSSITLTPEELGRLGEQFDTALTIGNSSTAASFTAATAGDLLVTIYTTTATN